MKEGERKPESGREGGKERGVGRGRNGRGEGQEAVLSRRFRQPPLSNARPGSGPWTLLNRFTSPYGTTGNARSFLTPK